VFESAANPRHYDSKIVLGAVLLKKTDRHSTVISRQPLFTRSLAKIAVAASGLRSDFIAM
jgi:hypothetical protein